jgi:putative membrane protein
MWFWNEGMGWWMMFGGVWSLLFLGGLIALIVWIVKRATGNKGPSSDSSQKSDPLSIAKERYAKGEITRDEFEQMKKDLS